MNEEDPAKIKINAPEDKRHFLDDELEEEDLGYNITKELLIEAWSKYRPPPYDESKPHSTPMLIPRSERKKNKNKGKDLKVLFGD